MPLHLAVITIINALLAIVVLAAAYAMLRTLTKDAEGQRDHLAAIRFYANSLRDLTILNIRAHMAAIQRSMPGLRDLMDEAQTMQMEPVKAPHLKAVPAAPRHQQRTPRPPAPATGSMWSNQR